LLISRDERKTYQIKKEFLMVTDYSSTHDEQGKPLGLDAKRTQGGEAA
jgi:hypothetical protein